MDRHTHIHIHLASPCGLTREEGVQLMEDVTSLNVKLTKLVSTITAERGEVQEVLKGLRDDVTRLTDQIASGSPASQTDLNAFGEKLDAAIDQVGKISEANPLPEG